jgi:hypothetical protein
VTRGTALPGSTWRLEPNAGFWLDDDELAAVTDWMADNQLERATAQHPVVVERGTITYGQDRSPDTVRGAQRDIATRTVPLRTPPPAVRQPSCSPAQLARLQDTFARHEWSAGFGGICVDCSHTTTDAHGRII